MQREELTAALTAARADVVPTGPGWAAKAAWAVQEELGAAYAWQPAHQQIDRRKPLRANVDRT